MPDPAKDTIYIDIDDEITGIIDKLRASDAKLVALVLPKRASVFQSIVNMKLLKRAADSAKKTPVLITAEAGLLPLAGAAGVHVAKTLTSKPAIPLGPDAIVEADEAVPEDAALAAESAVDRSKTIGQLAGSKTVKPPSDGVETVELPDDELPAGEAAAAGLAADGAAAKTFEPPKKSKNKKLKVPNFERFRLWLILGALLLIVLIGAFIFANLHLDKATINIKTDATNIDTNLNLNLDSTAKTLDTSSDTVPAKVVTQQKTYSQEVTTTGQTNQGTKAQGSVTMSAGPCSPTIPADVPAGSGLSNNNQTYITQDNVSFVPSVSHGQCTFQGESSSGQGGISIIAQSGGTSYNVSGVPFVVASRSDITASGSASGGTDSIVQSVNQNDINNAKAKISTTDTVVKQALTNQLQQAGYYPVAATYSAGTPTATNSANVGSVANSVTVTETITYTMFGVHQSDLTSLLDSQIDSQINTSKQSILDDGLSSAVFNANNLAATTAQLTMSTTAVAGPQLNVNAIKQSAAGLKAGDVESQLGNNPDVVSVSVKFSPFWVSSVPKKASHITVNIAKPTTTAKASSSNGSNP